MYCIVCCAAVCCDAIGQQLNVCVCTVNRAACSPCDNYRRLASVDLRLRLLAMMEELLARCQAVGVLPTDVRGDAVFPPLSTCKIVPDVSHSSRSVSFTNDTASGLLDAVQEFDHQIREQGLKGTLSGLFFHECLD